MVSVLSKPLGRVLAAGLGIVAIAVIWFVLQIVAVGGPGRLVIITVHRGDSLSSITPELHTLGVINSPLAFRIDTLLFGAPTVQIGSYEIAQNSSFARVKSVFGSKPNAPIVYVVPGLTLHEVALQVASFVGTAFANSFVVDANEAARASAYRPNGTFEGLIGPGSYLIKPGDTPGSLLQRMTTAFNKQAASVGFGPSTAVEGLSAYQLLIAASIVEKEGYYTFNMPQVARVIFNRLAAGQQLQMDSTVLYSLGLDGGRVTPAMLALHNPYNTYWISGLTPTPICTVSSAALSAVLHAPPGPWLYFVLMDKSGKMAFSSTYAQQKRNEQIAAQGDAG
jgi:UPF0755 protein